MSYQALYRTYRPTKFNDVVGQKHVIKTLKNAVQENRVMHAYIFSGPRGIGKTTIARILAKAVNCEKPFLGEPCNECPSCQAIFDEETTDIVELDAASNNGVDEMRDILERVNFLPSRLKKKVYIIDEAHMLSTSAFNALLKTLEEPPSHVIFILATTEPYKIPATILSRCQRFDFKQLTIKELSEQLRKIATFEDISITDDAIVSIAEAAEGGMRDALGILDQVSIYNIDNINEEDVDSVTGRVTDSKIIALLDALNKEQITDSLNLIDQVLESGKEAISLVKSIIRFSRSLLLYKNGALHEDEKKIYQDERFINLANEISEQKLFYFIDVMVDVQNKMRFANSQKIFLEIGILKIIDSATIDLNILNKVKELENKLENPNGISSSSDLSEKDFLLNYDNKIKRINNTLEKYDIPGFKEYINAKINMLEEIAAKFATLPDDLIYRLEKLEEVEKMNKISTSNQESVDIDEKINRKIEETFSNYAVKKSSDNSNLQNVSVQEATPSINSDTFEQIMDLINQTNDNIYKLEEKVEEKINNLSTIVNTVNNKDDNFDDIENKITEVRLQIEEILNDVKENEIKFENDLNAVKIAMCSSEVVERLEEELKTAIKNMKDTSLQITTKIAEFEKQSTNLEPKEEVRKRRSPFEIDRDSVTVIEKTEPVVENISKPKEENSEPVIYKTMDKEVKTTDTTVVIKTQPLYQVTEKRDETAKVFDAKIVERILNQAREQECRNQKVNIVHGWSRLDEKVGNLLAPIAKILMDGKFTANGYNELLIVYPNAGMCNNLMSPKVHANARQILKMTFGKDYDFIALPENTWQEKRLEYTGQYSMGNKYPKLSPINNPELKVIINSADAITSKKSQTFKKAENLFGSEFVEREDN